MDREQAQPAWAAPEPLLRRRQMVYSLRAALEQIRMQQSWRQAHWQLRVPWRALGPRSSCRGGPARPSHPQELVLAQVLVLVLVQVGVLGLEPLPA